MFAHGTMTNISIELKQPTLVNKSTESAGSTASRARPDITDSFLMRRRKAHRPQRGVYHSESWGGFRVVDWIGARRNWGSYFSSRNILTWPNPLAEILLVCFDRHGERAGAAAVPTHRYLL